MAASRPEPARSTAEVLAWLTTHGWARGRDIGEQATELIDVRVRDAERQGVPLSPSPAAIHVIHTYGLLRLTHPKASETWFMTPTIGYDGDAALITELAAGLGLGLFPVGYEDSEHGLLLVDETGRWFHLHHTGGYFLGADENDAFHRFLNVARAPDAEDYFTHHGPDTDDE